MKKTNRQDNSDIAKQFEEQGRKYERRDLFKQVALTLLASKAAASPVGLLTRARLYTETILEGARLFANEPSEAVEQKHDKQESDEEVEDASWEASEKGTEG